MHYIEVDDHTYKGTAKTLVVYAVHFMGTSVKYVNRCVYHYVIFYTAKYDFYG